MQARILGPFQLEDGGRFGTSVNERKQELIKYLGRTYRKFLSNGLRIVFDPTDRAAFLRRALTDAVVAALMSRG